MLAQRALQPVLFNKNNGNDAYTKLLLHCNGANAGTVFSDSSFSQKAVTAVGNAQSDNAQFFFGGSSLLLDGTGDYLSIADSDDWDFPGDFSVDFRVLMTAGIAGSTFVGNYTGAASGWAVKMSAAGTALLFHHGDTIIANQAWTPALNTKYHIMASRAGNKLSLFVDGVPLGDPTITATSFSGATAILAVGRLGNQNLQYVTGNMGEVRIRNGAPGKLTNFIPPTREYS